MNRMYSPNLKILSIIPTNAQPKLRRPTSSIDKSLIY